MANLEPGWHDPMKGRLCWALIRRKQLKRNSKGGIAPLVKNKKVRDIRIT